MIVTNHLLKNNAKQLTKTKIETRYSSTPQQAAKHCLLLGSVDPFKGSLGQKHSPGLIHPRCKTFKLRDNRHQHSQKNEAH